MQVKLFLFLIVPLFSFSQNNLDAIGTLLQQKKYQEAKKEVTQYLKEQPNAVKALEYLGDIYYEEENWDAAISTFEKAKTIQPSTADLHFKYGASLSKKALTVSKLKAVKYIEPIKSAFTSALQINPNHILAHFGLARFYMHVPGFLGGSNTKAKEHVDKLLQLAPFEGTIAEAHFYEDSKNYQKAEQLYKKAIAMKANVLSYQHLVDLYVLEKEYKKAIAVLDVAYQKLNYYKFKKQREALQKKL